jgi:hypothetical protein
MRCRLPKRRHPCSSSARSFLRCCWQYWKSIFTAPSFNRGGYRVEPSPSIPFSRCLRSTAFSWSAKKPPLRVISRKMLSTGAGSSSHSMADHPRASGRKALRATPGFVQQPRGFTRTTAAAGRMRGFILICRLGCIGTALICGMGLALVRGHAEKVRRPQNGTW